MTWLVWRQYRLQFFLGTALLAAFAVLIAITGVQAANQRLRVMLCIHAKWVVPASDSAATSGAPQNSPTSTGAPSVMMTRKPTA